MERSLPSPIPPVGCDQKRRDKPPVFESRPLLYPLESRLPYIRSRAALRISFIHDPRLLRSPRLYPYLLPLPSSPRGWPGAWSAPLTRPCDRIRAAYRFSCPYRFMVLLDQRMVSSLNQPLLQPELLKPPFLYVQICPGAR